MHGFVNVFPSIQQSQVMISKFRSIELPQHLEHANSLHSKTLRDLRLILGSLQRIQFDQNRTTWLANGTSTTANEWWRDGMRLETTLQMTCDRKQNELNRINGDLYDDDDDEYTFMDGTRSLALDDLDFLESIRAESNDANDLIENSFRPSSTRLFGGDLPNDTELDRSHRSSKSTMLQRTRMKEREEVDHVLQALEEEKGRLDPSQVGTTTPSLAFSGFHSLRALDSKYAQEAVTNARLHLNATLRSNAHTFDSLHLQEQDLRLSKNHEKSSNRTKIKSRTKSSRTKSSRRKSSKKSNSTSRRKNNAKLIVPEVIVSPTTNQTTPRNGRTFSTLMQQWNPLPNPKARFDRPEDQNSFS